MIYVLYKSFIKNRNSVKTYDEFGLLTLLYENYMKYSEKYSVAMIFMSI